MLDDTGGATLLLTATKDEASLLVTELDTALISELELSCIGVDSDIQLGSRTVIATAMGADLSAVKGRDVNCITLFPVWRCLFYQYSEGALLLI